MVAIECDGLSKKFNLRHQGGMANYSSLRDVISDSVRGIWKDSKTSDSNEEFWAVKDVSFTVRQGDRVGIIGRNGAGKSTLLKILCRITEPTSGWIGVNGRVASLLEVGTGFHPELTGRENIFLNGSILGMNRLEIKRKFDEIVEFAEVEKFLDTPVKRYSSGMYVRLAFSVAAHLEPEVLVVDEVLAVGDAQFQEKCMGKMREVSGSGRTILFVSHNMASIEQLCNRAIWLHHGRLMQEGSTTETIASYLRWKNEEAATLDLLSRRDRQGAGRIVFESVSFVDYEDHTVSELRSGGTYQIIFRLRILDRAINTDNLMLALGIDNIRSARIAFLSNELSGQKAHYRVDGDVFESRLAIEHLPFKAGQYTYSLFVKDTFDIQDWVQNAGKFDVTQGDFYGSGKNLPDGQGDIMLNYRFLSSQL